MDEQELRAALAEHTIAHSSGTYRAALIRWDTPLIGPKAVDLDFSAVRIDGGGDPIRAALHLAVDSLDDKAYVLEALDGTVRQILDGDLPPGTIELL